MIHRPERTCEMAPHRLTTSGTSLGLRWSRHRLMAIRYPVSDPAWNTDYRMLNRLGAT